MGPCQTKLVSYGRTRSLCVGGYGEGSPDLHQFVAIMSNAGAIEHLEALGSPSLLRARTAVRNKLYASVGAASARGLALLRLERLGQVIAGSASGRAADERRRQSEQRWRDHERAYRDRHAYDDRTPGEHAWCVPVNDKPTTEMFTRLRYVIISFVFLSSTRR